MLGSNSQFITLIMIGWLLAGCLLNEEARRSSSRQAIKPARYDEGTLAINHNAATGERRRSMYTGPINMSEKKKLNTRIHV